MKKNKFKIWDNENNCFWQNIYEAYKDNLQELLINLNGDLILRTLEGTTHESMFPSRFELLRYTGFKDCENQEIYENYILYGTVEYDNGLLCITEDDYIIATLDEDEGCWVAQDKEGNNIDLLSAYLDYKVVGNLYETPELFE